MVDRAMAVLTRPSRPDLQRGSSWRGLRLSARMAQCLPVSVVRDVVIRSHPLGQRLRPGAKEGHIMSHDGSTNIASALVKTEGMYMGVLDRQSSANTPQRFEQLLQEARSPAGVESWATIPRLNALLEDLAAAGVLLSWVLVFDGVFRVCVGVLPEGPEGSAALQRPTAFVGETGPEAFLSCPSGEIVVESLHRLGDPAVRPLVRVSPGRYRVRLGGEEEEQAKHQFLDDVATYPEGDGPDWILYLQQV